MLTSGSLENNICKKTETFRFHSKGVTKPNASERAGPIDKLHFDDCWLWRIDRSKSRHLTRNDVPIDTPVVFYSNPIRMLCNIVLSLWRCAIPLNLFVLWHKFCVKPYWGRVRVLTTTCMIITLFMLGCDKYLPLQYNPFWRYSTASE